MKKLLIFLLLILFCLNISAQKKRRVRKYKYNYGCLKGVVIDEKSGQKIPDVIIKIKKSSYLTFSDANGEFFIRRIPEGTYNIEFDKTGYGLLIKKDIFIKAHDTTEVEVLLGRCSSDIQRTFSLGTIDVTATSPIINDSLSTTFEIKSGEIEHLQASSLGDALKLAPGIVRKGKVGLSGKITTSLRGFSSQIETFGTSVIVDGVQISNNADIGGVNTGGTVQQNANEGLDLRLIPADNIDKIEVIQGVPSVKYGDVAEGIVKVKLKDKPLRPKLKFKYSRDTKDLSFLIGKKIKDYFFNFMINYAYSERDLRKKGDEWQRVSTNVKLRRSFFDNKFSVEYNFIFTRIFDDEKPTDYLREKTYNHGFISSNSLKFYYKPTKDLKLFFNGYFNMKKKDIYKSKLVQADPTSYIGEVYEKGMIYNPGYDFDIHYKFYTGKFYNVLLIGNSLKYDVNRGDGVIINEEKNYYGQYSPKRSFSYNWFPGMTNIAFYVENETTGRLLNDFSLKYGMRVDFFGVDKFPDKTNQGTFLSPRVNFKYNLLNDLVLRIGFGKTAKVPPFGYIYSQKRYYSFVDTITMDVQTYGIDGSNKNLKGYYEDKYEAGLDFKIKKILSLRVNVYKNFRKKTPVSMQYPIDFFDNPLSTKSEYFRVYKNLGKAINYGIESIVKTSSYRGINFLFSLNYRYSKVYTDTLTYHIHPDISIGEPTWHYPSKPEKDELISKFYIHYVSKKIGVWFTLTGQYIVYERNRTNDLYPSPGEEWKNNWYRRPGYFLWDLTVTKSIIKSFEFSFYVNNLFDEDGNYYHKYYEVYYTRASGINFGLEISGYLDDF